MLIILPPSETKAFPSAHTSVDDAGSSANRRIDVESLSFPELTEVRRSLIDELSALCKQSLHNADDHAMTVLGLGTSKADEIEWNAKLWDSPTMPALDLYTGVCFDAVAPGGRTQRHVTKQTVLEPVDALGDSARQRIAIGSALFGIIGANDPIPHYRLSASVKLGGSTVKSRWENHISDVMDRYVEKSASQDGDAASVVFDFRSGSYRNLGLINGAIELRVETEMPDGSRKVVSHFNKHYKGLVARELAQTDSIRTDSAADDCAELISRRLGYECEVSNGTIPKTGGDLVTMIIPA